jgi:hypothetical protein
MLPGMSGTEKREIRTTFVRQHMERAVWIIPSKVERVSSRAFLADQH